MRDSSLSLVTAPATEPVTIEAARLQARIDWDVEDALLGRWIQAAREHAEEYTSRAFVAQTLKYKISGWPCGGVIKLPRAPVLTIDSVKYYDAAGVLQTLTVTTDYQTWIDHLPPLIAPAPGKCWPPVQCGRMNTIEIVFSAGYGQASGWPARAEQAILVTVAYWNTHRGDTEDPTTLGMPKAALALLDNLWTGSY